MVAQGVRSVEPIAWAGSDTEAAFLSSLTLRRRTSDQSKLAEHPFICRPECLLAKPPGWLLLTVRMYHTFLQDECRPQDWDFRGEAAAMLRCVNVHRYQY